MALLLKKEKIDALVMFIAQWGLTLDFNRAVIKEGTYPNADEYIDWYFDDPMKDVFFVIHRAFSWEASELGEDHWGHYASLWQNHLNKPGM